ncbi:uncharacterized protein LOC116131322 [Pistacia vera]|uniref:uncharacterized protein LOC116131322 n=1 Tax=Pistacia vera TaxID=55513 RepID=UPI0012638E0B|nr:uncharacterized protein LOC116131322 [Pistacia vera]
MYSNYARLRKRASYSERPAEPPKREEIAAVSDGNAGISGEKTGEENAWFSGPRVKVRWLVVICLAIVIASFSSLVHKNFSLQEQVSKRILDYKLAICRIPSMSVAPYQMRVTSSRAKA